MAITGNLKMLIDNTWDDATLSLSTGVSVASLPLANSQFYDNEQITRINSTSAVIVADFSKRNQINTFNIYRHNLSNSATMRVQYFDGENGAGAEVYDSQTIRAIPAKSLGELNWPLDKLVPTAFDDWHIRFSTIDHDYFIIKSIKLTIVDVENEDGYIDFARIYCGKAFSPSVNFSYGHDLTWLNSDTQTRSAGGAMFGAISSAYRALSFSLDHNNQRDRSSISKARRTAGNNKDIFVSMFPGRGGALELEHTMAAMFTDQNPIQANYHNNFTNSITLAEV
jgi:hypothetical protein